MSINLSTALSGVSAANERLRASSATQPAERTQRTERAENRADPPQRELPVEQTTAAVKQQSDTYAFVANLRVLQSQIRAEGVMLDIHA